MKKHTIRKLSLIGLVSLMVSMLLSAVLPFKSDKKQTRHDEGQCVPSASNPSGFTCKPGGSECMNTISGPSPDFESGDEAFPDNPTITNDTEDCA